MKRILALLIIFLVAGGMSVFAQPSGTSTTTASSDPEVFIDFANLADTTVDFSKTAGAGIPEDQKKNLVVDLGIKEWEVHLASSSQIGENQTLSTVRPATTKSDSKTVLGVRIHFPSENYNSYAVITPPFEIPAYSDKPGATAGSGDQFSNKGVLKNVGPIKYIEVQANGRNFPYGLGIIIEDQDARERIIFVDYLNFTGWRTLVWKNPNYITEVRNRDLRSGPLYPRSMPFIKLKGFIIYRDAATVGGDFVTYIKDVRVAFDKAVTSDYELDVDDEALWSIIADREEKRKMAEMKRLGNLHVLRYLEKQKMYTGRPATGDEK